MPPEYLAAGLCLMATMLIGCDATRPEPVGSWEPCAAAGAQPFATLSTSGGLAGVQETVSVQCDGTVMRDGQVTAHDATLVPALVEQLRASGVLDLPDGTSQPQGQCADCFVYELELAGATKPRSWSATELGIPEPLRVAIDAVRNVDATQ